jgi:RNA polymerase sigma-70 factor (ECF subfamily)
MQDNASEIVLQQGLIEGNVRIFDYLFQHYYSGLVVFAIKIVHEKEVAEDIVQEFFYRLWSDRNKLVITKSIKSYFFTSVKNKCFDYMRHQKVRKKTEDLIGKEILQESITERDFIIEMELKERIEQAIERLPEKCRKIFILNRMEGYKPDKIAEKENISIRTVEGHIGKALRLLREDLKPFVPAYIITLLLS